MICEGISDYRRGGRTSLGEPVGRNRDPRLDQRVIWIGPLDESLDDGKLVAPQPTNAIDGLALRFNPRRQSI